jgi:dienelactone hydrolase
MPRPGRRPGTLAVRLALVVVVLAATACAASTDPGNGDNGSASASAGDTAYTRPGPYAVGTTRVTLADGDAAQLWYPADPAAVAGLPTYIAHPASWLPPELAVEPALAALDDAVPTDAHQGVPVATPSGDGFPVVLFSHDAGGNPEQSTFLTVHLASWGFVVAAPDHRSDDLAAALAGDTSGGAAADVVDLDAALGYLQDADGDPTSMMADRLDLTRVGVVGIGTGGASAVVLSAQNPLVGTYVALAPTPVSSSTGSRPGLTVYGTRDQVVPPAGMQQLYAGLPEPRRLVVVDGAGHAVFSDTCAITAGGTPMVTALAAATHPPEELGEVTTRMADGCRPPDVPAADVQPLVLQVVTAQLRAGLGIDPDPVGLDTGLGGAFPGVTASYYQHP